MKNKICLVTGANSGIGKQVCRVLASKGAEVVMSARNAQEANRVKDQIISETGNSKIHLILADLSSFEEVVALAEKFASQFERLDVLINNAGIFLSDYTENNAGIEIQWMVNYLAPYLLTRRLENRLTAAPEARVINVSSNAHFRGSIDFNDLNHRQNYQGFRAYAQSKLGNVLFTKALVQHMSSQGLSAYSLHPGVVNTGIGDKNSDGWMSWVWRLARPFMISTQEGAQTITYLATMPSGQEKNGSYFVKCKLQSSSELSNDRKLIERLWMVSENQVKHYL